MNVNVRFIEPAKISTEKNVNEEIPNPIPIDRNILHKKDKMFISFLGQIIEHNRKPEKNVTIIAKIPLNNAITSHSS